MINDKHLITNSSSINDALLRLNDLAQDAILFVVDSDNKLIGSLTDGDVRRGLIKGISIDNIITEIVQPNPKFILKSNYDFKEILKFRDKNYKVFPVIDDDGKIITIINFRLLKGYLPIDVVVMAGGKGTRLRPLTNDTPKPLLKVGDKTIMEHNIDRLIAFGVDDFWFSINYLGDQIVESFGNGKDKDRNISIEYVWEDEPKGTIGAVSKINNFRHKHILVTNSDILTNLDYEDFYLYFLEKDADFAVLTIPYNVSIPYAVLEISDDQVLDFKEKPTYTYYSNGGIYLMKRDILNFIPKGKHFNTTDLIEKLIEENKKVVSYPLAGYWLDIGKKEDLIKARKEINNIKF